MTPVSKRVWLSTMATKGTKTTDLISRILTVVCILLILGSFVVTYTTSLDNLLLVDPMLELMDMPTVSRLSRDLEDSVEDLEDDLEVNGEFLSGRVEDYLEDSVELLEDLSDNISLRNLYNMRSLLDDMPRDVAKMLDANSDFFADQLETISLILNVAVIALFGSFLLFAILSAVSGFCRCTILTVITLVLYTPFLILFFTLPMLLLVLVAHIALIVTMMVVNGSYKKYRRSVAVA